MSDHDRHRTERDLPLSLAGLLGPLGLLLFAVLALNPVVPPRCEWPTSVSACRFFWDSRHIWPSTGAGNRPDSGGPDFAEPTPFPTPGYGNPLTVSWSVAVTGSSWS